MQSETVAKTAPTAAEGLKVGPHQFRKFNGLDAAFGADIKDYPSREVIPEEFQRHRGTKFNEIVSALFFKGGSLSDHGVRIKPDIDRAAAMTAIRALLCSFAPKHEHKEATVAWCLSEWTEPLPAEAA